MKYNKGIIFVVILLIITVGVVVCNLYSIYSMHAHLNTTDIESIRIWGNAFENGNKFASEDEIRNIVTWFNSITNIRSNKDFAGTTPEAGIVIKLKSGQEILVIQSGVDFEIQRFNSLGKHISYWGKQSDLRELLDKASKY